MGEEPSGRSTWPTNHGDFTRGLAVWATVLHESRGYKVDDKVASFVNGRAQGKQIIGCFSPEELVRNLKRPRRVMIMVKAGAAVDAVIDQLMPLLEPGDILIDGGNSHFPDTKRRTKALEAKGLLYIGTGVSGGEEGALLGPSIMPGGNPAAWPHVKKIFQSIAAKTDKGEPCCDWVGANGGRPLREDGPQRHRVRRHADDLRGLRLLKRGLGLTNEEMHDVFARNGTRRARFLPDRNHPRHPRLQGREGARWWTSSSTPPARRARASGP
jgi:6-phosphogluconate dehydrogenase